MCKENGCKIRPSFNKEGETKALYWINPENTTNNTIETIQLYYDM